MNIPLQQNDPDNPTPPPSPVAGLSDPNIPLKERMVLAVRQVYDPEIPVNIYDLGLVYDILFDEPTGKATLKMTLTTPNCPEAQSIPHYCKKMLETLPEVKEAQVDIVWDPPWSRDMMSDAAKLQLGMM